jgi:hypothetical protein
MEGQLSCGIDTWRAEGINRKLLHGQPNIIFLLHRKSNSTLCKHGSEVKGCGKQMWIFPENLIKWACWHDAKYFFTQSCANTLPDMLISLHKGQKKLLSYDLLSAPLKWSCSVCIDELPDTFQ